VALLKESTVSLEETIATHLRQRGWHLALAETTTGGIMAVRLVRLAGSSAYFDRSIVAYSKEAKLQSLGVDPGVFERHGSVSIETACAMAEGLHRLTQADMVLAGTGIVWKAVHKGFCGAVRRIIGARHEGGQGRDIDNRPAATGDHPRVGPHV